MDGVDPVIGFFMIVGLFMIGMVVLMMILAWVYFVLTDPMSAMKSLFRGVLGLIRAVVGIVVTAILAVLPGLIGWAITGSEDNGVFYVFAVIGLIVAACFFRLLGFGRRHGGGTRYPGGDYSGGDNGGGWGDGGGDGGGGGGDGGGGE